MSPPQRRARAAADFLYDFVVGDDWRVAVGVVAALALTYLLSRTSVPSWWLLPAATVVLLTASIRRATQPTQPTQLTQPTPATPEPPATGGTGGTAGTEAMMAAGETVPPNAGH